MYNNFGPVRQIHGALQFRSSGVDRPGSPAKREFAETAISGYIVCALRYDCSTPAAAIRPQQPLCDTNPDRQSNNWFRPARPDCWTLPDDQSTGRQAAVIAAPHRQKGMNVDRENRR
jgi:hypothetical protein